MLRRVVWPVLTAYRKKVDPLGSRSYSPLRRSVEFLATKLLAPWRSLTSVYLYSSHSLVPSKFDGSPYQPDFWGSSGQPQNVRLNKSLVSLSRKIDSKPSVYRKTLQARVTSGAQTKTSLQSNAHHPTRNGQARRRPVEPSGSNTRLCLVLVSKTFIFQKLL